MDKLDTSSWKSFVEGCWQWARNPDFHSRINSNLIHNHLDYYLPKLKISELKSYEIPPNLVTKISARADLFSDEQKREIIKADTLFLPDEISLLFSVLKKRFEKELGIKAVKEKEVETPKSTSLNKFRGKLSEEQRIDKLLKGLYDEII